MHQLDKIKICGLSTPEAIDAVIGGGATHMGLIFFEKSPRHLSLEKAAGLSKHAGSRITKVAVSVNADDAYLGEMISAVKPGMLQLHGSETPERVSEIKMRYGLPVMKAIALSNVADLEGATSYEGVADMILFDAKAPVGVDVPGGNGVPFDWGLMDHFNPDVPYMLSGGLNTDNIHDALARSGAKSIDVSSGVESSPGVKDLKLVREFLETVSQKPA